MCDRLSWLTISLRANVKLFAIWHQKNDQRLIMMPATSGLIAVDF